jgi:hypothetical protein
MRTNRAFASAAALAAVSFLPLAPGLARACACGCGVFDVGDGTLPSNNNSDSGFTAWFRYSYMNQDQNWEGASRAAAADNQDKDLRTSFFTVGGEYMINRRWTIMAELAIYDRSLTTTDDGTVFGAPGSLYTGHLTSLGDLQITGMYTGFSPDMTTGLSFGVKVPTGDDAGPNGPLGGAEFDRDSLPGTGSTDLMLGAYHVGALSGDGKLAYFVQARYQFAVAAQSAYRPGNELDGAVGLAYDLGSAGPFRQIQPTLQLLDSFRVHDTGSGADPLNSGYERILIAPGIKFKLARKVDLYTDIEIPLYQHLNAAPNPNIEGTSGQLAAPVLVKAQINYGF